MSRQLSSGEDAPRFLKPTTFIKIAQRMLSASHVITASFPKGFYNAPVLDVLLSLYLLEEDASYLSVDELVQHRGMSEDVMKRWLSLLIEQGLAEKQHDLVALTPHGHDTVNRLIEAVYNAQRALD